MPLLDDVRAALKPVVEGLPSQAMSMQEAAVPATLRAAMERLVEALRLALAPPTSPCPHCGALGMVDATRCGSCWQPLARRRAGAAAAP